MNIVGMGQAHDEAAFGGKAAQLAHAMSSGLPVPPGVALDAEAAGHLARGDRGAVRHVNDALRPLEGRRFAVRSSACGEDSAAASFAGQHKTCLNVSRHGVADAIAEVWRSAVTSHAAQYRDRMGLAQDTAATGVVVQVLIAADVAGVLFTRDPVTGADERLVEASWGLGEAVVAGQVIPDRYRLSRSGVVLERDAGVKDEMVAPAEDGGTIVRKVEQEAVTRHCLDDHALTLLAGLADACEAAFDEHRDIEWALADGRLWLLQARPITWSSR